MKYFLLATAFFGLGLGSTASAAAEAPLSVFVSVLPQKFFAERIAGDAAKVFVMVGPGRSPATYEPTPRQMALLDETALYFSIDVPFERVWLPKIAAANRDMKVVATGREASRDDPPGRSGDGHGHGEEDPHFWTNPLAAVDIARAMTAAFAEADPARAAVFRRRLADLETELRNLDAEIRQLVAPLSRRALFVFHPSWGAFADTYGLEQVAIEQGGGEPGARYLAGLIERARREKVTVIFTQPQFDRRNAETVARAVGGRVVEVDPLAEDYLVNLRAVSASFAEALR